MLSDARSRVNEGDCKNYWYKWSFVERDWNAKVTAKRAASRAPTFYQTGVSGRKNLSGSPGPLRSNPIRSTKASKRVFAES